MTAMLFTLPKQRLFGSTGTPLASGKIYFYDAGTTNSRTVYSDSARTVSITSGTDANGAYIQADSAGYLIPLYLPDGQYKIAVYNSSNVLQWTADNQAGPLDLSSYSTGSGTSTKTVVPKNAAFTVSTSDASKRFDCDPSGGSFVGTLPSASSAGNGAIFSFRHVGSSGTFAPVTTGTNKITSPGDSSATSFPLTEYGEEVVLVSDGANYTVDSYTPPFGTRIIRVVSRLTAPPSSPAAGAIYMVSGTPTGSWSSAGYAANDLLKWDGQTGYIRYVPYADCGWIAYVQGEDLNYQYQSSSWVALSNITAPAASYTTHMHVQYAQANGTDGGAATTGARTTYPLNTFVNSGSANVISGATLTTNKISGLPVGWYRLQGGAVMDSTDSSHLVFRNSTTSTDLFAGPVFIWNSGGNIRGITPLEGVFQVTDATHEFIVQYWAASAGGTTGLGRASAFSDGVEVYGSFIITSLAMQQGPIGATGAQGATGRDAGMGRWTFSTSTSTGPASGTFRFNNATIASATALYINETDADSNSLAATIQSWDDSTSTIKGYLTFRKQGTPSTWAQFAVTGSITDNGSDDTVTISYVTGNGSFSASDSVLISFSRTGDQGPAGSNGTNGTNGSNGATGATGAAGPSPIDYTWDTGTSAADPGSGKVRANNATLSSATAIYINETDRLGNNLATYIQTWDDSTTTAKGVLQIVDTATPANRAYFTVTGSVTDNGTYDTLTVTYLSGVTSFSAGNVALLFYRTGDKGADGAGTGDVSSSSNFTADNRLVRTDRPTTDNKNVQQSGITVDDSNNVSGVGTLASGANTITAASSTALAVGANGTTNPVLQVDSATASVATGIKITGNAAASRVALAVISSGTDEGIFIDAKGAGTIRFGNTSTGNVEFSRSAVPTSNGGASLGSGSLSWSNVFINTNGLINWGNGNVTITHAAGALTVAGATSVSLGTSAAFTTGTIELGAASDTTLSRSSAGVVAVEGATVATLSTAQTWTKHQGVSVATLTDGATISWDVSTGQKAKVTLGGNRTMNAVTNAVDGYTYTLEIFQDATGSRLISTWTTTGSGSFDFGTAGAPTLTTTASKADILCFEAVTIGGTLKLRYLGAALGFA